MLFLSGLNGKYGIRLTRGGPFVARKMWKHIKIIEYDDLIKVAPYQGRGKTQGTRTAAPISTCRSESPCTSKLWTKEGWRFNLCGPTLTSIPVNRCSARAVTNHVTQRPQSERGFRWRSTGRPQESNLTSRAQIHSVFPAWSSPYSSAIV